MFETCVFTRHARERVTTRAIPPMVVEMIVAYGDSRDAGDGVRAYALTRRSMRALRRYAGPAIADTLDRFRARNAYVVAAGDRIVTCAFARFAPCSATSATPRWRRRSAGRSGCCSPPRSIAPMPAWLGGSHSDLE